MTWFVDDGGLPTGLKQFFSHCCLFAMSVAGRTDIGQRMFEKVISAVAACQTGPSSFEAPHAALQCCQLTVSVAGRQVMFPTSCRQRVLRRCTVAFCAAGTHCEPSRQHEMVRG